jgi:hypothetical protein
MEHSRTKATILIERVRKVDDHLRVDVPSLGDLFDQPRCVALASSGRLTVRAESLTEHEVTLFVLGQPAVLVLGIADNQERSEDTAAKGHDSFDQEEPSARGSQNLGQSRDHHILSRSRTGAKDSPPPFDAVSTFQPGDPIGKNTTESTGERGRTEKDCNTSSEFYDRSVAASQLVIQRDGLERRKDLPSRVYQQLKISLTPGMIPDSQRPRKSLKRMKPAGELMEAAVDMTIGIRSSINIHGGF